VNLGSCGAVSEISLLTVLGDATHPHPANIWRLRSAIRLECSRRKEHKIQADRVKLCHGASVRLQSLLAVGANVAQVSVRLPLQ
jgi:hypothetical protein